MTGNRLDGCAQKLMVSLSQGEKEVIMPVHVPEELKNLIIVHPHGLPSLADEHGNLYLCTVPKTKIGTWNRETDELILDCVDLNDRLAVWRLSQIARGRTERITEYSIFPKKMPVAKQPRPPRSSAATRSRAK